MRCQQPFISIISSSSVGAVRHIRNQKSFGQAYQKLEEFQQTVFVFKEVIPDNPQNGRRTGGESTGDSMGESKGDSMGESKGDKSNVFQERPVIIPKTKMSKLGNAGVQQITQAYY